MKIINSNGFCHIKILLYSKQEHFILVIDEFQDLQTINPSFFSQMQNIWDSKKDLFKPTYTGKQLDETTGLYYFNARWYDPSQGRFITQDPARDGIGWYVYCNCNPITYHDTNGCFADGVWDTVSLISGAVSFGYNVKHGNKNEAFFDAVGMIADAAALAIPFVPGGIGTTRKALKATKIAAESVGGVEAVISGGQSVAEGLENGDYLEASLGALQAFAGVGQLGSAVNQAGELAKSGSEVVKSEQLKDIELKYKEGWTTEQKAAADLKDLTEANTVKTQPQRSKTSARSRYKNANPNTSLLQTEDIDHTIDLQLGGLDTVDNMNPLDKSVNRSLGSQISNKIKDDPKGTKYGTFTIK